jgi:hypothetical protein
MRRGSIMPANRRVSITAILLTALLTPAGMHGQDASESTIIVPSSTYFATEMTGTADSIAAHELAARDHGGEPIVAEVNPGTPPEVLPQVSADQGARRGSVIRVGERVRVASWSGATHNQAPSMVERAVDILLWNRDRLPRNTVRISGTFVEATADTLALQLSDRHSIRSVPANSIVRLEVHRRAIGRYTALGAAIGAASFGALGYLLMEGCFMETCSNATVEDVLAAAAVGAFVGAPTGAVTGLLRPWKVVRLPVAPTVSTNGDVQLGVSMAAPW